MRGRAQGVRPKEADECRFSCPLRPAPRALGPGELFFSRTPATIVAVLGSCVAVALWDPETSAGGMNHYLLPRWRGGAESAKYGEYFEALLPLLGSRAVLAVDNVLMSGTVAEGRSDGHWSQEQIDRARAFNHRVLDDEQLVGTVTPVGDGVLVAVRR